MPPLPRSCPKCGAPLLIPQTPSDKVTCPQCRATFVKAAPTAPRNAIVAGPPAAPVAIPLREQPQPAPLSSPPRRRLGDLLLLAGFGMLLVAGVIAAVILFRQDGPQTESEPDGPVVLPTPPKAPPDPRIKIVQPAIDKGVAFLKARLLAKDPIPPVDARIGAQQTAGIAGLMGLALLECDVPANDPAILRVAEIIRATAPQMDRIYVLSASLFFLNRWHESRPLDAKDRKLAQSLALRIIAGQRTNGVWAYDGVLLPADKEAALLANLKQGTHKPTAPPGGYSISNSQFAMLALWGARKHGVPVRPTLLAAAAPFNATQFPDGHWIYSDVEPGPLWTTATCAGLMALAMERALREDKEFVSEHQVAAAPKKAGVNKAFAYVARSIGRKKGDPGAASHQYVGTIFQADSWGDLYFLWSIERVGMIYGQNVIGGKDWYDWGYPIVLKTQSADGSWSDRHGQLIDTCFALLFLKRANLAKDLTDKLRELSRGRQVQAAPPPAFPRRGNA